MGIPGHQLAQSVSHKAFASSEAIMLEIHQCHSHFATIMSKLRVFHFPYEKIFIKHMHESLDLKVLIQNMNFTHKVCHRLRT